MVQSDEMGNNPVDIYHNQMEWEITQWGARRYGTDTMGYSQVKYNMIVPSRKLQEMAQLHTMRYSTNP